MGMSTKQYLSQIERLDRAIQNKLYDIGKLRNMATSVSPKVKDVDVQTSIDKDKTGSLVVKIVSMEAEVDEMIDKMVHIIDQIDEIDDIRLYEALTQRYVHYKPISEICIKNITSVSSIKRIIRKAEKEFEKKYGKEYL